MTFPVCALLLPGLFSLCDAGVNRPPQGAVKSKLGGIVLDDDSQVIAPHPSGPPSSGVTRTSNDEGPHASPMGA